MKLELTACTQSTPYTCVAACLRMVLGFFGGKCAEDDLARACNTDPSGATLTEAAAAAESLGFSALYDPNGTLEMLMEWLQRDIPVIVGVAADELEQGMTGGHAVVVCGMEKGEVMFLDPMTGTERVLELAVFLTAWRRRRNRALVVLPSGA